MNEKSVVNPNKPQNAGAHAHSRKHASHRNVAIDVDHLITATEITNTAKLNNFRCDLSCWDSVGVSFPFIVFYIILSKCHRMNIVSENMLFTDAHARNHFTKLQ